MPQDQTASKSGPASAEAGGAPAFLRLAGGGSPLADLEFVTHDFALAPKTWYKIGGPAKYYVQPRSLDELKLATARCIETNIPIYVLGLGANLLVADEGVDGAVFKLDEEHWRVVSRDGIKLSVGAGVDVQKLVLHTARAGLAGIECMAGIPGTVGGAIKMNAGGKFGDFGSRVLDVTVMDSQGTVFTRTRDDLHFEYRQSNITAPFVLGCTLELEEDDPERITERTKEIWMYKRNSQPLNTKSAGCMFKNPRGLSAGALIDQAGLKGMRVGGAEVSAKHANFLVAHPGCSAADIRKLAKLIQERVYDKHGVALETEVKMWP
jgi:UDP-N-acetylmuramate dehydrogenase